MMIQLQELILPNIDAFESDSEVSNSRTQVFQVLNPFDKVQLFVETSGNDEVELFVETSGNDQLQWTTGKATEKNDPFDKFEKRLLFRRIVKLAISEPKFSKFWTPLIKSNCL